MGAHVCSPCKKWTEGSSSRSGLKPTLVLIRHASQRADLLTHSQPTCCKDQEGGKTCSRAAAVRWVVVWAERSSSKRTSAAVTSSLNAAIILPSLTCPIDMRFDVVVPTQCRQNSGCICSSTALLLSRPSLSVCSYRQPPDKDHNRCESLMLQCQALTTDCMYTCCSWMSRAFVVSRSAKRAWQSCNSLVAAC